MGSLAFSLSLSESSQGDKIRKDERAKASSEDKKRKRDSMKKEKGSPTTKKKKKKKKKKEEEEEEADVKQAVEVWVLKCRHVKGRRSNPRCDTCRGKHVKAQATARWASILKGKELETWEVCDVCEVEEFGEGAGGIPDPTK